MQSHIYGTVARETRFCVAITADALDFHPFFIVKLLNGK